MFRMTHEAHDTLSQFHKSTTWSENSLKLRAPFLDFIQLYNDATQHAIIIACFVRDALHTHSPELTADFLQKNDYAKPRGVDSALLSIIHAQQEDITLIYLVASMSSHDLIDCQYLIDSTFLSSCLCLKARWRR